MNISEIKFDFKHQVWLNPAGHVVPEKEDWESPCGTCHSPARMTHMNNSYEYYTCLNKDCNAETKVN